MADTPKQSAIGFLTGKTNDVSSQVESFTTGSVNQSTGSITVDAMIRDLMKRSIPIPSEKEREQNYINRNTRDEIPLDVSSGVGPATRAALSFRPTVEDQTRYLQKKFGEGAVRMTDDKEGFIVRVMDEQTGNPKDVLVDERQTTMKDLVDLIGVVPELAGAIASFVLTKKIPGKIPQSIMGMTGVKGLARDVTIGTVGAQSAGSASDIMARGIDEGPIDFEEIMRRRVAQGAGEAVVGGALAGGAKVGGKVLEGLLGSPFIKGKGVVQYEAMDAVKKIEAETGITIPMSAAEMTGDKFLSRTETFLQNVPGGAKAIKALKTSQENKMRDLQSFMLGASEMPDEALVGRKAVNQLRSKARDLQLSDEQSKQILQRTATDDLLEEFGRLSTPERALFKRDVGESVRGKAIELRNEFRAKNNELYGVVKQTPGGTDPIIPTVGLKERVNEIIASLPREELIVETPTGLLDAAGNSILRTSTEKPLSKAYVPGNVKRFLEGHNRLPENMTLDELRQMRRMVNNAVQDGEALPGIDTKYLKDISNAMTQAMDEGVTALPDGSLKKALGEANAHYRDNHGRFREVGITEIFKEPNIAGSVGDAQIVKRIIGGEGNSDLYFQYQKFLGNDSKEFRLLKRSILDDVYERNLIGGDASTLDAQSLLKDLSSMDRDIAKDLFKGNTDKIRRSLHMAMGAQGKIPLSEVERAIATPDKAGKILAEAIKTEKEKDKLFKNRIIKKFVSGDIGEESVPADEFVNRFLDTASIPELQQIVNLMGPESTVLEQIRSKTIQKLFHKAARTPTAEDLIRNISNDPTQVASGASLVKAMGGESDQVKLKTLLGEDAFELLVNFAKVDAASAATDQLGGVAGSLVGGGILNRLIRLKFGELMAVAKYRIAGTIIANPAFRQWVSGKFLPNTKAQTLRDFTDTVSKALIVSAPMIETAGEEFVSESASYRFLQDLKDAVLNGPSAQEELEPSIPDQGTKINALEFLQQAP